MIVHVGSALPYGLTTHRPAPGRWIAAVTALLGAAVTSWLRASSPSSETRRAA